MSYYNNLFNDSKYSKNRELVISVQENERQRIARDLHDASLQRLTHIVHQLELSELYMDTDIDKSKLELLSAKQNIKSVIEEIRHIIFDLHPMSIDDLGLKQTYEYFFDTIKVYTSFIYDVYIDEIENDNMYFLLSVYRIGRECVMNAIRHSKGNKIVFKCVNKETYIYLLIEDNGVGFSENALLGKTNHYGLKVIDERIKILNGSLKIDNSYGTKIEINIPLIQKLD